MVTAVGGPFLTALAEAATGSYRGALLSLLALFVAGGLLLASTDTDAAVAAAREAESGQ